MAALIQLAIVVLFLAGMWKTFEKAGRQGWEGIIPFYNFYILLQIVGKPTWWLILCFIPVVNLVIGIIVSIALAEKFGLPAAFGFGLALLGFIFFPILGFGSATFQGGSPPAAVP